MFKIKCSNGQFVQKTTMGDFIDLSKNGKVWHSRNIAEKNLRWCQEWLSSDAYKRYHSRLKISEDLTYELIEY